jgi:hypothetical protein
MARTLARTARMWHVNFPVPEKSKSVNAFPQIKYHFSLRHPNGQLEISVPSVQRPCSVRANFHGMHGQCTDARKRTGLHNRVKKMIIVQLRRKSRARLVLLGVIILLINRLIVLKAY